MLTAPADPALRLMFTCTLPALWFAEYDAADSATMPALGVLVAVLVVTSCWPAPQETTAALTVIAKIPCRKCLTILCIRRTLQPISSGTRTQSERADKCLFSETICRK